MTLNNPVIAYKDGLFYGYLMQMINDGITYWCVFPAIIGGPSNQTWYIDINNLPFKLEEIDVLTGERRDFRNVYP